MVQTIQLPGTPWGLPDSMAEEGFLISVSPEEFISNTPISFVEPNLFLIALIIL